MSRFASLSLQADAWFERRILKLKSKSFGPIEISSKVHVLLMPTTEQNDTIQAPSIQVQERNNAHLLHHPIASSSVLVVVVVVVVVAVVAVEESLNFKARDSKIRQPFSLCFLPYSIVRVGQITENIIIT